MSEAKKPDTVPPSRLTRARWVAARLRETKEGEYVPWAEIEKAASLPQGDSLEFVLMSVAEILMEDPPYVEFERSGAKGLLVLDPSGWLRKNNQRWVHERRTNRRILDSLSKLDSTRLTSEEQKDMDHLRKKAIHMKNEFDRVRSTRFLSDTKAIEAT